MKTYEQYTEPVGEDGVTRLSRMAAELQDLEKVKEDTEALLKTTIEAIAVIAEKEMPELMEELGIQEFTTADGVTVACTKQIFAALGPSGEERAQKGCDWLDANGHGALIKNTVVVAFSREQAEDAKKLAQTLKEKYSATKVERKVEPSTLKAFVVQALARGEAIPLDVFGVFDKKMAKIKGTK